MGKYITLKEHILPEYQDVLKYAHFMCANRLAKEIYGKPITELTKEQGSVVAAACILQNKVHPMFKYVVSEAEKKKVREQARKIIEKLAGEKAPEILAKIGAA